MTIHRLSSLGIRVNLALLSALPSCPTTAPFSISDQLQSSKDFTFLLSNILLSDPLLLISLTSSYYCLHLDYFNHILDSFHFAHPFIHLLHCCWEQTPPFPKHNFHYNPSLLKILRWLPITDKKKTQTPQCTHKVLHKMDPDSLSHFIC